MMDDGVCKCMLSTDVHALEPLVVQEGMNRFASLLLLACGAMGKRGFANAPGSANARRSATVNRHPAAASGTQVANSASMPGSASSMYF